MVKKKKDQQKVKRRNPDTIPKIKGGDSMAVLARPSRGAVMINKENSKEFIRSFNQSVITDEHLEECAKISQLFKKDGKFKDR